MAQLKRLLSIDGGGIRGIIPGQIIVEIEKAFNIKAYDYFDFIAGTSTGGILACAYLCPKPGDPRKPKFSSMEVVDLYFEWGDEIFDLPFFHKVRSLGGLIDEKYPADGIEDVLHDHFKETWIKDLLKPCLITAYDIKNRKGHFFYQHKANNAAYNFKVKDVARATSAAPTYFEAERVFAEDGESYPLIDGGVFVNNPALCTYSEARSLFKTEGGEKVTAKDMKILSLGTGFVKKKYPYSKAKNWGKAEWIQPIIDIMMSGSSDVAHFNLEMIFGTIDNPSQYLRINKALPRNMSEMDNAEQSNMDALKDFAIALFKANKTKIKKWLDL